MILDWRFLLLAIVLLPVTAWGLTDGIERSSRVDVVSDGSSYIGLTIHSPVLDASNDWTADAFGITHAHADAITMEASISLKEGSSRFSIVDSQLTLVADQMKTIRISDSSKEPGTFMLDVVFDVEFQTTQAVGGAVFERPVQVVVE